MHARDPEDVVRGVLEPGEEILWYGCPDPEVAIAGESSRVPRLVLTIGGTAALGWFAVARFGPDGGESIESVLRTMPQVPIALAAVLLLPLLLRAVGLDGRSRLRRYFERLAYGITNRRVVLIEGDDVLSLTADRLETPRVVDRARGYGDVLFGRQRGSGDGGRDPVRRERARVGFKAVPHATQLAATLERWVSEQMRHAALEVTDFVEERADGDTAGDPGAATARLVHAPTGLIVDYPEEWTVKVRDKEKPFGKTFLDSESWRPAQDGDHWDLARIEGPAGSAVDVEIFETPPVADYDSLATGWLARLAGELIDSDPAFEQHGLRGFTVARRMRVPTNPGGPTDPDSGLTPTRHTVLHDGRYQVTIVSWWPERSPGLARAVELTARSVRLGD